jgi:hypothetical protein
VSGLRRSSRIGRRPVSPIVFPPSIAVVSVNYSPPILRCAFDARIRERTARLFEVCHVRALVVSAIGCVVFSNRARQSAW